MSTLLLLSKSGTDGLYGVLDSIDSLVNLLVNCVDFIQYCNRGVPHDTEGCDRTYSGDPLWEGAVILNYYGLVCAVGRQGTCP